MRFPHSSLILCATQRCGSTMIVEDMRNATVLGHPEEWFVPWQASKPDINWRQALSGVIKRATSANGIAAIKVMANQIAPVEACLVTFMDAPRDTPYARFAEITQNCTFIKIQRDDIVFQAISRVISRQTGINHATGKKGDEHFAGNRMDGYSSDYNAQAKYQYGKIREECLNITLENLVWTRFFEMYGIVPEVLRYEEVSTDGTLEHINMMARLSGVELPLNRASRKMVKLGNARNDEWRNQFYSDLGSREM
ncbi:Stf0 family sulfotransferase [Celeribacter marinus]|uniref:Stf0 family sulfotransferase n=1 Tax=Celeribacter marinus TaxID=1397108 RepID=UPI003175FD65